MQYICRTRAQTTDFSHDAGQKDESGCNSFKYDFRIPATSRAHGDTDNFRHHHGRVAPLRTPGHQTWSSVSNCLVSHIARITYRTYSETLAPDPSNPAGSEYRMSRPRLSLLTLITRGRSSLSPPSVSSHALPLLLSQAPTGPHITHQTRSLGSVTPSHSAASCPEDFTQKRK